ncbi:hypothetical protein PABG_11864 [Paracoccidioides brasiliensis Pb03]|nr:hypothetical protein PABG_11864 [Paracoccidioides brasiliensis Pb03]
MEAFGPLYRTLAPALVPPTQEIGIITTALAMGIERAWKGQVYPKTVGGILPLPATKEDGKGKAGTLVLLVGAQRPEDAITDAGLCRMKANFEYVKVVKWKGRMGDETPSNREEMFPITQFLVKRWRSTSGVPDGSIEIS